MQSYIRSRPEGAPAPEAHCPHLAFLLCCETAFGVALPAVALAFGARDPAQGGREKGMGLVRLFQISDLHLGRPFGWLPAERREPRRRDQRSALERGVHEAIVRGAHAILVPGDLFDQESVDADTLAFALEAFNVPGCPPVLIAPGNHDPYFPRSLCWNERLLQARGRQWPAHVHLFTGETWSAFELPGLEGVRVWGRCFVSNAVSADRPLAAASVQGIPAPDGDRVEIGMFHGSREGGCPHGTEITAPFSDEEALASPFTYMAVGHYHASSAISARSDLAAGVRLAYAGSAVSLDLGETGSHGAIEVRIEYGRRLPFVETEFVPLDRREVHALAVEVTRCGSAEQVDRRVDKALDDAGVAPDDLVTVQLTGRLPHDVRYRPAPRLRERVFHLRVDARQLRPDHDLESYRSRDPATTEERFVRDLLGRLDAEGDPAQKLLIENALYYGLDAFRLGEVVPAYEEME